MAVLDEAADNKRDRAANCTDCADQSCVSCQYRLQIADAYDNLAVQLMDATRAGKPAAPPRAPEPGTRIHPQAAAELQAATDPEAGR